MKRLVLLLILFTSLASQPIVRAQAPAAVALNESGKAKFAKSDYAGAVADFSKAIETDPNYAMAYNNRGAARNALKDYQGAIADYSKAIEADPNLAMAYYNRAISKNASGDSASAIEDYTRAIDLNPRYATAYNNRGLLFLMEPRELDKAIADFTKAIEFDPHDATYYENRGLAHGRKTEYDAAIADFDKSLELDPRHASACFNRGAAKRFKGDAGGAMADYRKAMEIDPKYAMTAQNSLAWILATSKDPKYRDGYQAVIYARRAAELTNWSDPETIDTLAAAYAEAGNFSEAIRWQNKVLSFADYMKQNGDFAREQLKLYQQRRPYRD